MHAQEMLEHEAVVQRSGAGRGQVQDLEPRLALHLRIEVGEIQRHGVRSAEDHPVDRAVLRSGDLEEWIAATGLKHEPLGRVIDAGVEREADRDEEECGYAEAFHGSEPVSYTHL